MVHPHLPHEKGLRPRSLAPSYCEMSSHGVTVYCTYFGHTQTEFKIETIPPELTDMKLVGLFL